MEPLYLALVCFQKRKYEKCIDICTELLQKNPYDLVSFERVKRLYVPLETSETRGIV